MKGISPLIVTIVIVAVVIAISIAYALWITSMTTNTIYKRYVKLEFYDAQIAIKTILLYVRNTGSAETTITHVIINNQEAKITWAWDVTENKYLGYGEVLVKPGHIVEIAVKTQNFQLVPGVLVEFKLLTSSGITLYRTIELSAHPALSYIQGGYFNTWDYTTEHFAAIYHQFWRYYNVDLFFGTNIERLTIQYNMWYGLFQLGEDYSTIFEIRIYKDGTDYYFDLKAYKNGSIVFFDNIYYEAFTGYSVYDPHSILFDFMVHSPNIVELKLYIDGKIVVDRNYTEIYGAEIVEMCYGVWDRTGLYDMYIDNIVEKITWTNGTMTTVEENFDNLSTDYFTYYVSDIESGDVQSFPILLDNGIIGFAIDHT